MIRGAIALALAVALIAGSALSPLGLRRAGAQADFALGQAAVVNTDALNLRAAAGLGAAVVAVLPSGTTAVVGAGPYVADGYTWYGLQAGALWGWSAGEFLSAGDDGGGIGAGDAVRVVDGPLNLRSGAGLAYAPIGVLPTGTLLEVRGGPVAADGYTWLQVFNFGVGTGWAAYEFMAIEPGGFPGEDGTGIDVGDGVRVVDGPVNFRAAAGLGATILNVAPDGSRFLVQGGPVFADGYTWFQVFNYGFGPGWMAAEFLAVDPAGFPGEEGGL